MKILLYVGIDVDDNSYNVGCYCPRSGLVKHFRCNPDSTSLIKKLRSLQKRGYKLKTCHEATYLGFSLHRQLEARGIESMVVAPSLISRKPGKKVKTDRIDCLKLAKDYAHGDLTAVHVPDAHDESVRDLIRTRASFVQKRGALRREILSILRRHELDYKQETGNKCYWTLKHLAWLKKQLATLDKTVALTIGMRLEQCDLLTALC